MKFEKIRQDDKMPDFEEVIETLASRAANATNNVMRAIKQTSNNIRMSHVHISVPNFVLPTPACDMVRTANAYKLSRTNVCVNIRMETA